MPKMAMLSTKMTRLHQAHAMLLTLSWLCQVSFAWDHCKICQDGSEIRKPNAIIKETDQTCAELADEAKNYDDPISCRYYHRYGNTCGCKNTPPPESYCGLCQRENDQIDDSLWLDGYEATCGTLKTDAAWNLWGTYIVEEEEQSHIGQDNCDYYHHVGSLCGCKFNRPPETGCNLCPDGSQPLLPDKTITPNNEAEATCAALSIFTQYQQVQGTHDCQTTQTVAGSYCGCTDTPTNTDTCDFCPQGLVIREGWAPDVEFAHQNRIFYFKGATCIKVAMLASSFSFPCGSAPLDFVEACCQPATELLGPEVFVQERPGVNLNSRPGGLNQKQNGGGASSHVGSQNVGHNSDTVVLVPEGNGGQSEETFEMNWEEFIFFSGTSSIQCPAVWSSLVTLVLGILGFL